MAVDFWPGTLKEYFDRCETLNAKQQKEWEENARACAKCLRLAYHGRTNGGRDLECYNCRHITPGAGLQ